MAERVIEGQSDWCCGIVLCGKKKSDMCQFPPMSSRTGGSLLSPSPGSFLHFELEVRA